MTLVLIGLVGGIITGLSPCVLPVLPVVFLGGAGSEAEPGAVRDRRRPYLIVAGLTLSFAVFPLFGSWILASLHLPDDAIRWVGLGLLLRHSAGGIGATVGLLFVVTILVNFLPQSWQNHVDKWIPALAGGQVWMARALPPGNTPMYGPWPSFAILCGYAALAVAAGVIFFRKRDA